MPEKAGNLRLWTLGYLKKIYKILASWKLATSLLLILFVQYCLVQYWSYITIYYSSLFSNDQTIKIAAKDLHIPHNIKVESIDRYETTGEIKIIYLRSTDCLISISRIERLSSEDWEKMITKLYRVNKFEEYPDRNFFYLINAASNQLVAYQLTYYIEKERYLSQNFFIILDQVFFEFYGPEITPEKAMEYIREIFYHDIGEDFDWDYIRITDIEDLKL